MRQLYKKYHRNTVGYIRAEKINEYRKASIPRESKWQSMAIIVLYNPFSPTKDQPKQTLTSFPE